MSRSVLVISGPNLNLLGKRQPEVYGKATLDDVEANCRARVGDRARLEFRQSNHEGALVDWIQEAQGTFDAIVINPGAYTHTSIAILDALLNFTGPVIEVHVSNIFRRESFRHHSFVSNRSDGVVAGFGIEGYEVGVERALSMLA